MNAPASLAESPLDWAAVWQAVASDLSGDKLAPKFLTEDGVRMATLRVLGRHLDVVQHADVEYGAVNLGGGRSDRLDLVVREPMGVTVVEFKYPREPRQTLPPWPDHLGSYLADTYRLGSLIAADQVQHAIQLLVSGAAFIGYMERTTTRLGLAQYSTHERTPRVIRLKPTAVTALAATTRGKIGQYEQRWEIDAVRTAAHEISGKRLWLAAYDVQGQRVTE